MALPELKTIDFPDGKVSYREMGTGPSIVFLHGLAGNSRSWEGQFDHFSKTHHVIAWDTPGYGRSDNKKADINIYANCLNQLLVSLIKDRFLLVGHSMGGVLAGHFANRFKNQLVGLVLSCTHAGNGLEKGLALPERYQQRVDDLNAMTAENYGTSRAKAMLAPNTPSTIFDKAANIAADTKIDGLTNAIRIILESDNTESLSSLDLPTMVISGAVDPVVPKEKTDQIHSLVPGSQTAIIPNAGHAPYLEKNDNYNEVISKFTKKL
jgi:3-oxoadipate enol-lactonase